MAAPQVDKKETVLEEAARVVDGLRQASYGSPWDNHGCTAEMWTSFLRRRGILSPNVDVFLTAEDVCLMNILQKVSREANEHKRDNLVDTCGYSRNVELIKEWRDNG